MSGLDGSNLGKLDTPQMTPSRETVTKADISCNCEFRVLIDTQELSSWWQQMHLFLSVMFWILNHKFSD